MIVTPLPYGRMCNRLVLATHFICHVEKHGGSYLHLAFIDYARYFENTRRSGVVFYRSTRGDAGGNARKSLFRFESIIRTYDRRGEDRLMDAPDFLEKERRTRCLIAIGWLFRDPNSIKECGDVARSFFTPAQKHSDAVSRLVEGHRKGCDTLVGVHIRQTDYAKFVGGRYLYPLSEYRRCMESIAAFSGGMTRFLVASDGPVDSSAFDGLDVVRPSGHPFQDNLALSRCDLIIGPPSTYSKWAAFIGKVPLCYIREAGMPVTPESFRCPYSGEDK